MRGVLGDWVWGDRRFHGVFPWIYVQIVKFER